jgi:AAA15 family ATPase/GTPase
MDHESGDGDGQRIPLSWEDESLGTRRYFALGGPLAHSLHEGSVLVIDELDASLHPLLVQTLIRMFHDPAINRHNAQLIFNTHDTTLLNAGIFRRDQIWFVGKDRSGASHLYPLLEFSPRKDEALERGYLLGRYGAIPFVEGLLDQELMHGAV